MSFDIRKFKLNEHFTGILLMLLHAIAMAAYYVAAKNSVHSLHPNQVAFLYKITILIVILPWCMIGGLKKNLKTKKIGIHVTRSTFSTLGTLCFFYSLRGINVSDAAAITYLENTLIVTIGVLYFKEKLTHAKIVLAALGLAGALFVTKPGFVEFSHHYFYLFLALLFWAVNNTSIKILGKTERTKAQLFYTTLLSAIFCFPLALNNWQPVQIEDMKFIFLISFFQFIHMIAFFKAFKFADISAVMPFDYARLIFTGLLGYCFLGEVPDQISMIGYALIITGGLYLIQYDSRKNGIIKVSSKKN